MGYQFEGRVRYSETDSSGRLSLFSLINYFQDSSTFHSLEINVGPMELAKKNRIWMLSSWQIDVQRYPGLGEEILVKTWPYDFRDFFGYRNFELLDGKGNRLACANSIWIYVDISTGHPVKVGEEEIAGYILDEKLDMEYEGRKVRLPKERKKENSFYINRSHLDTNLHVNNGKYVELAMEYLPEQFEVKRMRAEYKHSAVFGDKITPQVSSGNGRITVALCDREDAPYGAIEFGS